MSHPLPYPASRYMSAKLQPCLIRARLAIKRALCNMHTHCSDYVSSLEIMGAGEFCWAPWVTCQKCTKFHLHSILPRLQQLSAFSSLAKPFIASALSHENPLASIKTCINFWRPQNDGWSSPGELESLTDLTSSEERGRGNERETETYNIIFQKGVWFHPAGIWKGVRERAPGILYVNFPLYEKISTRKE